MKKRADQPIRDERIDRETSAVFAVRLPWMMAMQGIVLLVKVLPGSPLEGWWLDALALGTALLSVLIWRTVKDLWGEQDEVLREMTQEGDSIALCLMLFVVVGGGLAAMLVKGDVDAGCAVSFLPLLVVGVSALAAFISRGLLVPKPSHPKGDGRKRSLLQRLFTNLLTAAVIAGIVYLATRQQEDAWPKAMLSGAMWFLFDLPMTAAMDRISQRRADKAVKKAEGADEDASGDA